jgi:5-methylcytosine-specific restriction endonuclease McrA
METLKRCSKCGELKPRGEYYRHLFSSDGLKSQCKDCHNNKGAGTHGARQRLYAQAAAESKRCTACCKWKSKSEFHKRLLAWGGLTSQCKTCHNAARNSKRTPEANRASVKLAYQRHPERFHARVRTRRARVANAEGSFTHEEFLELCALYGNRCLCCGEQKPLEPDHVTPISRGGTNDITNIQPLCSTCNKRKHAKTIDYRPTEN